MNWQLELPASRSQEDRPLTVREVVEGARAWLEQLPAVWVEGEISGFKAYHSGHCFFNLKDRDSALSCVLWREDARRLRERPAEGLKVFVRGFLTVDLRRGQMRLTVRQLLPTSEGGWHAVRLEQARLALEKDGLLDPARKRPLPWMPSCIGVVTSPDGAAWHDIVSVIERRWPHVELVLIGARVQGDDAPREIRRALALAERYRRIEVLIVGRGGGSKEDLWAFNDEGVARAVAACRVPVVSAVGHETDTTLTDLVADVRAATPTAAAEKVVPDGAAIAAQLSGTAKRFAALISARFHVAGARLTRAGDLLAATLRKRFAEAHWRLADRAARMERALERRRSLAQAAIERLGASLDALSPLRVLERGYAMARGESGNVLRRMSDFAPGMPFWLRVADGEVPSQVREER